MPTYISMPAENCFYQLRKQLRKQLVEKLKKDHLVTLVGPLGRGKTEEAKAFAYDHLKYTFEYDVVVWIDCSERETYYEKAKDTLGLYGDLSPMRTVFAYLEQLSPTKAHGKSKLSETMGLDFSATLFIPDAAHGQTPETPVAPGTTPTVTNQWLLILDNADESDLAVLPLRRCGDIILTSCNTNLPNLVFVPNLERQESQRLILRTLGEHRISFERSQSALALAAAAADFPAAVTELSRKIKHHGCSLENETKTYERQNTLFLPDVSLEQLKTALKDERRFHNDYCPNSLQVLSCLAQFGPFNVPRTLLYRWGTLCSKPLTPEAIHHALHDLVCKGYIELCTDRQGSPCFMEAPIINSLRSIFMADAAEFKAQFKRVVQALVNQLESTREVSENHPTTRTNEEHDMSIWHAKMIFQRMLNAAGVDELDKVLNDVTPIVDFIPPSEQLIYLKLIQELSRYHRRFDNLKEAILYSAIGIKFIEETSTYKLLRPMIDHAKRLSRNGGYIERPPTRDEFMAIYLAFKQWVTTLDASPDQFTLLAPLLENLMIHIHASKSELTLSLPTEAAPEPKMATLVKTYLESDMLKSLESATSHPMFLSLIALFPNDIIRIRTLDGDDGVLPLPQTKPAQPSKHWDGLLINKQLFLIQWSGSPDHTKPIYPYHTPLFPVLNPLKKSMAGLKEGFTVNRDIDEVFLDNYAALLTYHATSLFKQQDDYNTEALAHLQLAFKELNMALVICFNRLELLFGGIKEGSESPTSEPVDVARTHCLNRILYLKKMMIEIALAESKLHQKSMQMLKVHLNYDDLHHFFYQFPGPKSCNKTMAISFEVLIQEAKEDRHWWPIHFRKKLKLINGKLPNLAQKAANKVNPFVEADTHAKAFFSVIKRWPHVFSEHKKLCEDLELRIQAKGMNPDLKIKFEALVHQVEKAIHEKSQFCQGAKKAQGIPTKNPYEAIIQSLEAHLEKPPKEVETNQIKLWLTLGRLYIKQYKHGTDFNKTEKAACLLSAQQALKRAQKMYYVFEREDHPSWELYDIVYSLAWISGHKESETKRIDPRRESKIIQYLLKIRTIVSQLYDGSTEKAIIKALKLYNTFLAMPGSTYPKANNLFALPLKLPLKYAEALLNKLNAVIQDQPDCMALFLERAEILVNLGAYDQAISDYKRYLKVYPDCAPALAGKGFAHYKLGDAINRQIALCDFASAREKMPDNPFIQYQQVLCQKASKKMQMNLQRPIAPTSKFALFIKSLSQHFAIKLKFFLDKAQGKDLRVSKMALFGKAVKAGSGLLPSSVSAFGVGLDINLKEVVGGLTDVALDAHEKNERHKNALLAEAISDAIIKPGGTFSGIAQDIAIIYEDQIGVIARDHIDRFAKFIAGNMVQYLRSNIVPPYIPLREKLITGTAYAKHRWFDVSLKIDKEATFETLRSKSCFKRTYLTGCHSKNMPFGWSGHGVTARDITLKAGIRTSDGELYALKPKVNLFGYRAGTIEEALEKGFSLVSSPIHATIPAGDPVTFKELRSPHESVSISDLQTVLLSMSSKKLAMRDTFDRYLAVTFGLTLERVSPGPYGGSCQFMATATQLVKFSTSHLDEIKRHCPLSIPFEYEHITPLAQKLRELTVSYLLEHVDDFEPFIGKKARDDDDDEFNHTDNIPDYALRLTRGSWGGALSLRALSCVLRNDILILHPDMMIPRATTMENRIFRFGDDHDKPYDPSTDLKKTIILVYNGKNHYDTIVSHPGADDPRLEDYLRAQMVRSSHVLQKTKMSRSFFFKKTPKDTIALEPTRDAFFQPPWKEESSPSSGPEYPPRI